MTGGALRTALTLGMSDSAPRSSTGRTPAPRAKVTISLTAPQAEKLRALWQEHSGPLHALLVGWCRDAQNASDILQETFRRLASAPATMDKMENPRAFLAVAARRIAVDFARRTSTRNTYQTAAGAETPAVQNPGPTDETLRRAISGALVSLPPDQRSVFEHKLIKGKTLEEIAKLENISLNTAASRLRYALDKIRVQLRPYYDDLNRKDFKNMNNDPSQLEQSGAKRIITPLEPKRVPSVAPGLEGLAALAADDCHAEPAPDIEAPAPEFVEVPAVGEVHAAPDAHAEIAGCAVGGNAWEYSGAPDTFDMPEMVTCEVLPPDGHIPSEWLENPESFLTTLFDGNSTGADDTSSDAGDPTAFDLNSGFEICVLPVPENADGSWHDDLSAGLNPEDAAQFHAELTPFLLSDYQSFLHDNPDWIEHNQGGEIQTQVVTSSGYFADIEFGTPGEASAFDLWFENTYMKDTSGGSADGHTGQDGSLNVESDVHYDGSGLISYLGGDRSLNTDGTTIPWLRSGDDGGVAYNLSGGVLNGSELSLGGSSDFPATTSVTGGVVVLGDNTHVDHADGNHLTLSNGSILELQGGKVVSGDNVYAYNPDASHTAFDHATSGNHAAVHSDAVPVEIAATLPEVGGVQNAYSNAAAGLAPTPNEALIVEFGVLSPSESPQSHAHQDDIASHDISHLDIPHVIAVEAGHESASADMHHDVSASSAVPDTALPHPVANHEAASHEAQAAHKVDAPTAAAGAVAAGTVVQAGGVAPSMRRPLPRI